MGLVAHLAVRVSKPVHPLGVGDLFHHIPRQFGDLRPWCRIRVDVSSDSGFHGIRLEKRLGLKALPGRVGLAFFLVFLDLAILIGFVVGWKAKNLLGFPMLLAFLSSSPSFAASFKASKSPQSG